MHLFNHTFFTKERPIKAVPKAVIATLVLTVITQITWHASQPGYTASASDLPSPPNASTAIAFSMGEPVTLSKFLMLWLQAFDNQPGISVPFKELDYNKVISWLDLILILDEKSSYPLLTASRVYSEVPDEPRKRQMLEFVYEKFLESPDTRWQWMAHAVYVAKHRIEDLNLAVRYARALRTHATGKHIPNWAKQMELFILDEMGDEESARVLLGGLLESGSITDPNEIIFLKERLGVNQKP